MTPAEAAECAVARTVNPAPAPSLASAPAMLLGFPAVDEEAEALNRSVWAATYTACKEIRRATTHD